MKQQSVNARELGILVRDMETKTRIPHYLIPPNTPLPTSATQQFGTVVPNQKRVHLVIVESGTAPDQPYVVLGECKIEGLPPHLPEGSKIDVTISYDPQASVHVSAKDAASGKSAATEILRQENIVAQLASDHRVSPDSVILADTIPANPFKQPVEEEVKAATDFQDEKWTAFFQQQNADPVTLCNECGSPLDSGGKCPKCSVRMSATRPVPAKTRRRPSRAPAKPQPAPSAAKAKPSKPASAESVKTQKSPARTQATPQPRPKSNRPASPQDEGEDEFWKFVGE